MRPVEPVGNADQSGQYMDHALIMVRQIPVHLVSRFRMRFPVVPRDARHHEAFLRVESVQVEPENHIAGALVMGARLRRPAGVVQ